MMILSSRRQSLVFFLLAWMHRFLASELLFFSILKSRVAVERDKKSLSRVTLCLLFRAVVVSEFPPRSILAHTTERYTATAL